MPTIESVLQSNGFDLFNHCCRQVPRLSHRYEDSSPLVLLLADETIV